jgi:hypothetical protein
VGKAVGLVEIVLILALIAFMIWRRMAGQPLRAARLIVLPAVAVVLGLQELTGLAFHASTIAVLAIGVLTGIGTGAARGATVGIYERDGYLWYRYRALTVVIWLVIIPLRVGMVLAATAAGVALPTTGSLLVVLGVSFLAESGVIALRASRTGVPYAPSRRAAGVRTSL